MPQPSSRDRFLELLRSALHGRTLVKLTLGKPRGTDATLKNLFVRPVALKAGPQYAFLWRHATRDVTKNHADDEAFTLLQPLIGSDFLDAHLFTTTNTAQLETKADGSARLKVSSLPVPLAAVATSAVIASSHDRAKVHLIPADAPWLRALGVMNDRGHAREGMADKFRQIQKFAELLTHLLDEAFPATGSAADPAGTSPAAALRIVDMGSGKGYLTFAIAHLLGERATVLGIEARAELVELCNRVACESGLAPRLSFQAATISDVRLDEGECDVLIALHACDTATDDALARGIAAGARLLVVSPCCQKELRPQLIPPPVLDGALRHGIFQERQAEFVTDAMRAQLLECMGYRTKVFEFISTEHTAKNVMIAAIKARPGRAAADDVACERLQAFAQFYGIKRQRLADHLHVALSSGT